MSLSVFYFHLVTEVYFLRHDILLHKGRNSFDLMSNIWTTNPDYGGYSDQLINQ